MQIVDISRNRRSGPVVGTEQREECLQGRTPCNPDLKIN